MNDRVRLGVMRKEDGTARITLNEREIKGVYRLELSMEVGEPDRAVLYMYPGQVDVDADVVSILEYKGLLHEHDWMVLAEDGQGNPTAKVCSDCKMLAFSGRDGRWKYWLGKRKGMAECSGR